MASIAAVDRSMHGSLREEIQTLRRKVVKLETAETDNERLRKEISRLQIAAQEEKAQLEMEFMNQLTGVARENALKLEELEGRLTESSKVNRAISEQLADSQTPDMVAKTIDAIESRHRKEIVAIVDSNKEERESMQNELKKVHESRNELSKMLNEIKKSLESKSNEVESLKEAAASRAAANEQPVNGTIHKMLKKAHEENAKLKSTIKKLEVEASQKQKAGDIGLSTLQEKLTTLETETSWKQKLFEKEIQELQEKLSRRDSEFNKKVEELKSLEMELEKVKTDTQNISCEVCSSGAVKMLEQENEKLKNSVQRSETEIRRLEAELAKERVASQHENSPQGGSIVSRLKTIERENADLKNAAQKAEQINKRLEMELANEKKGSKSAFRDEHVTATSKALELENSELKNSAQKAETERKRKEMVLMQVEKANHDLKTKNQRLLAENNSLHQSIDKLKKENIDSQMSPTTTRKMAKPASETTLTSPQSSHENRTTQIIRQLEQNLKKEGQLKQTMTAGLKIRKLRSELGVQGGNGINEQDIASVDVLNSVKELQQQLEQERETTAALRRELQEVKGTIATVQKVTPSKLSQYKTGLSTPTENERDRVSLGSRRTRTDLSVISNRESTESTPRPSVGKEKAGPRTPVRGLVQSFERRISKVQPSPKSVDPEGPPVSRRTSVEGPPNTVSEPPAIRRATIESSGNSFSQLRSTFEANDSEDLKAALQFERQAVLELEEELTRQCEINCDLLKEIGSLTSETESSRYLNSQQFENRCMADQKEIEKMSLEISKLKSKLAEAEGANLALSSKLNEKTLQEQQEIDMLQNELSKLKVKVSSAEESRSKLSMQMERGATSDKQEIDRLKLRIRELQTQLEEAEQTIQNLEAQSSANEQALKESQQRIQDLEKNLEDKMLESTKHKTRAEELSEQVSALEGLSSELESKQDQVDGLNSLVNELQSNLADADETKRALHEEKEETIRLDSLVATLKGQLSEVEEKCETLTKDRVNQSLADEEKINMLQAQIDNLSKELAIVSESRDELESNEKVHQEKFDMLQRQVEEKVKEFEHTHHADKEAISRLREQVQSLQQELTESLDQIELLQTQLKKRDEVEETVEELTRKNQQSLDCQINKLQKELTNLQVESSGAEEEYKKKIQGLEEMIESLQSEAEERMDEKDRELEDLKRKMDNKDNFIGRLTKEKEQLVLSMNDMTSSRRNEIDELQSELMEMSTRSANQAREVQALKLQLEDSKYRKDEVERLRARVVELGDQLRSRDGSRLHEKTALEVENSDLRQRLRQASLERQAAEDKLREYVEEHRGGASRSVQVLRERNAALKMEVEKLNRKLRKIYAAEQRRQSIESRQGSDSKSPMEATRLMI